MSGDVFPIEERDFLTSVMLVWSGVREAICKVFPPLPIGGIGEVKGNLHHGGGGFCVAARADLFSMKILVIKHHGLLYFFDMMFVLGCKQLFFFFLPFYFSSWILAWAGCIASPYQHGMHKSRHDLFRTNAVRMRTTTFLLVNASSPTTISKSCE